MNTEDNATKESKKELTLQEKEEKVKDFRPIDDVFFETLAADIGFCQEMLQIILDDKKLTVIDVIVQSSERNIYGRSVRLDALCTLGNGKKCNVEVQRSDNDNHLKRVRFNAASIAVKDSHEGSRFEDIEDIIVVYISQFDIFKSGRVLYHVDSVIRETGIPVNDGLERVFVNTAESDETTISEFMECFLEKEVNNPKFPELTRRMNYLKHQEGGLDTMCEVMQRYEQEAVERAKDAYIEKGRTEANVNAIRFMVTTLHATKSDVLKQYSEDEYNAAIQLIDNTKK